MCRFLFVLNFLQAFRFLFLQRIVALNGFEGSFISCRRFSFVSSSIFFDSSPFLKRSSLPLLRCRVNNLLIIFPNSNTSGKKLLVFQRLQGCGDSSSTLIKFGRALSYRHYGTSAEKSPKLSSSPAFLSDSGNKSYGCCLVLTIPIAASSAIIAK